MSVFFGFLGARFSEFSPQGNPSVCHGRQLPLHRGAMGSRCPPGVDRLVFGLIGRRYFGGRGELRSPLSPHRNVFSKHSGVPVGLFSTKSTQYSLLQNTRPPGSLRSPSDAAPKCFFKTSRCSARLIRQAETLELQPLRGLRWAGGASLPPAPPSLAPGMRGEDAVDKRGKGAAGRTAKKRNARVFPALLLLYSVVRSADRTGFPDARRSGGAGGRRRQRARRSRRRRG